MDWKNTGKVSAATVLGPAHGAEDAATWEALAADGTRVEIIRAGDGSGTRPFVLVVRAHSPEGANGRARYPTLEEIQAAMNHVLPGGAVVAPEPWRSFGRAAEPVPAVGYAGILLMQVGAVAGSAAETRLKLSGGIVLRPGQAPGGGGHA